MEKLQSTANENERYQDIFGLSNYQISIYKVRSHHVNQISRYLNNMITFAI